MITGLTILVSVFILSLILRDIWHKYKKSNHYKKIITTYDTWIKADNTMTEFVERQKLTKAEKHKCMPFILLFTIAYFIDLLERSEQ